MAIHQRKLSEAERQVIRARHAGYVGKRFSILEDGRVIRGVIRVDRYGVYYAEALRRRNRVDRRDIDLEGCERDPSFKVEGAWPQ